jgi:hypothetical protein
LNHRGTEGTERNGDDKRNNLCFSPSGLCALCASVVSISEVM